MSSLTLLRTMLFSGVPATVTPRPRVKSSRPSSRSGGLVSAPDGSVLAMDPLSVLRLSSSDVQTFLAIPRTFLGIRGFSPDGIAVSPNGTVYLDSYYGNVYTYASAIIELGPNGKDELLWKGKLGSFK